MPYASDVVSTNWNMGHSWNLKCVRNRELLGRSVPYTPCLCFVFQVLWGEREGGRERGREQVRRVGGRERGSEGTLRQVTLWSRQQKKQLLDLSVSGVAETEPDLIYLFFFFLSCVS